MEQASVDLSRRMRAAAHRLGLTAFWRWWADQLAQVAPPALSAGLARKRLRPVLAFDADEIVLWAPVLHELSMGFVEVARIARGGDVAALQNAGHAAIAKLPRAPYSGAAGAPSVVVTLPRGEVLRKQFTLPAAVERDLKQTLAYDLDRHTPFKPDELYFDAVVIARDQAKNEIRVDWAAARRNVVDQAIRQAEAFGAKVAAVSPEVTDLQGPTTRRRTKLDLRTEEARPDRSWWRNWQLWAPLGLIALLLLAAVVLPLWQKRAYTIALLRVTGEARMQAEASSALRTQLEQQAADYNFALGKKYSYPSAMQVLDDVTKLMPDDTWITQFEVKSATKGKEPYREMMLKGESANAGQLVSLLEDSHRFTDAAPRSPTMKIQPGPGEIFDFSARVKPLTAPAPIEIATTTPTPPPADGSPSPASVTAASSADAPAAPPTPSPGAAPAAASATPPNASPAPAPPAPGSNAPGAAASATTAPAPPAVSGPAAGAAGAVTSAPPVPPPAAPLVAPVQPGNDPGNAQFGPPPNVAPSQAPAARRSPSTGESM
jgi:general secretion pathway protein L